ncbi:MAG TPA: PTS sugar transporter subunit IIA [Thermoanaerobaculia bacterium]|nr:PTS sugar transporter subunit IIA [Thermoanaerobaculia bacterium]
MNLRQLVDPELVFTDLPSGDRDTVLRALAERLEAHGVVDNADELYRKLLEREGLGSTAIGRGVAIPHCKLPHLDRVVVAVGVLPQGVDIQCPDQEPVRLFFLVVSPERSPAEHLQSLASISKWLKDDGNLERIRKAKTSNEVNACLRGSGDGSERG